MSEFQENDRTESTVGGVEFIQMMKMPLKC